MNLPRRVFGHEKTRSVSGLTEQVPNHGKRLYFQIIPARKKASPSESVFVLYRKNTEMSRYFSPPRPGIYKKVYNSGTPAQTGGRARAVPFRTPCGLLRRGRRPRRPASLRSVRAHTMRPQHGTGSGQNRQPLSRAVGAAITSSEGSDVLSVRQRLRQSRQNLRPARGRGSETARGEKNHCKNRIE